jgi:uncharacterized oxidoreductase
MSCMQLSGNKMLITGGASGIGLGLTERFIQEGNTVIVCGRRQEVLDEAKATFPQVITYTCDLAVEAERIKLFQWIKENHPDLNVLVNNAGIQNWMKVTDPEFYKKASAEVNLNIVVPIHLTELFLELKQPKTIMNVTSGLAFIPFSKVPVYCGTKAFFRSFTLSLRHQLKDRGIEVVEVIPPALNTDLGGKGIHDGAPPVSDFIESIFEQLKNGSDEVSFGTAAARAKANTEAISEYFSKLNP